MVTLRVAMQAPKPSHRPPGATDSLGVGAGLAWRAPGAQPPDTPTCCPGGLSLTPQGEKGCEQGFGGDRGQSAQPAEVFPQSHALHPCLPGLPLPFPLGAQD